MIDNFANMNDKETEKRLDEWWSDLEYLVKIRILLKAYPGYSITKLEERKIAKMWKAVSLEKQKDIYNNQFRYVFTQ